MGEEQGLRGGVRGHTLVGQGLRGGVRGHLLGGQGLDCEQEEEEPQGPRREDEDPGLGESEVGREENGG